MSRLEAVWTHWLTGELPESTWLDRWAERFEHRHPFAAGALALAGVLIAGGLIALTLAVAGFEVAWLLAGW